MVGVKCSDSWFWKSLRPWFVGTFCFLVSGCHSTSYVNNQSYVESGQSVGRKVSFFIDDRLYQEPMDCITILSTRDSVNQEFLAPLSQMTENALGRNLYDKIGRVINAQEGRRLARERAYDLENILDRSLFAQDLGCKLFARAKFLKSGATFVGVWSQREIGLEVSIFTDEALPFWTASHIARRSDGGVPLSLLSAPVSIFRAAAFQRDSDNVPSMIDDVMRRIFVTLPDLT